MEIRMQDPSTPGEKKADGSVSESIEAEKTKQNIISGEAFIESAAKQTIEAARDTASVTESNDDWGEEELNHACSEMRSYNPSDRSSAAEELSQLRRIYQELLTAILSHGRNENGEDLMKLLSEELTEALNKLLNSRLEELELLLKNFGSPGTMTALRAAIYRSVTGKSLAEAELNVIFGRSDSDPIAENINEKSGIRTPVSEEGDSGLGLIYEPAGKGTIKNNPGYAQNLMKETSMVILERDSLVRRKAAKTAGANLTISPMKTGRVYEEVDLDAAERFASYMNVEGNLFKQAALTGKSEELWGFLAALMSIKSQIFAAGSGINKGLAMDLREACDRMTDHLIQEMAEQANQPLSAAGGRKSAFFVRDVYKVFYYIMNRYQAKQDVNEAVNKGIRYAYQQFLKKQENTSDRKESEFFTKEKKDPAGDFREGKRVVEQNWKEFLDFLGRDSSFETFQSVMVLSPWGMLAEPETTVKQSGGVPISFLLLAAGVVFVLLIVFLL